MTTVYPHITGVFNKVFMRGRLTMHKYGIVLATIVIMSAFSVQVVAKDDFKVGDDILLSGLCSTESAVDKLVSAIVVDGPEGYERIMNDRSTMCVDDRHLLGRRIPATLVKKMRTVEDPQGIFVSVWQAKDRDSNLLYTTIQHE